MLQCRILRGCLKKDEKIRGCGTLLQKSGKEMLGQSVNSNSIVYTMIIMEVMDKHVNAMIPSSAPPPCSIT